MANEDKKDFNAMLHRATDMPRIQLVTDAATVQKYGGARMYFAPAADYDAVMKRVPFGKVLTVGKIREYFARKNGADFTDPITAGIFVSISAWASAQRQTDETPYWRTLKADGELNAKYPGGAEALRPPRQLGEKAALLRQAAYEQGLRPRSPRTAAFGGRFALHASALALRGVAGLF